MYFMDAVRLLLRRWYVAVVGIVLIAGGAFYTTTSVPTQYQASGEMLFLLPPDSTGHKTPSNPYINLVPGLTTTASMIATEAMTKDVGDQLARDGFRSEYSVALVPSTGPLLVVSSKDTDPAAAVRMRDRVMKWLRDRLDERQQAIEVPESQFIYTEATNVGKSAEAVPGNKIRAIAGVGGVGMILTLLFAFGLDRLLSRRQTVAELRLAHVEGDDDEPAPRQGAPKEGRTPAEPSGRTTGRSAANRPAPGRPATNGSPARPTGRAPEGRSGEPVTNGRGPRPARVSSVRRGS